jgi:cell division protein FtsB
MIERRKKKISVFWAIISFIFFSALTVFTINNIIAVNNFLRDNNSLKEDLGRASQTTNILKIEIEKLTSFERIQKTAYERLNLKVQESSFNPERIIKIKKSSM